MAQIVVNPDELHRAMSNRLGELEAENISLRLLLARASQQIDALETRQPDDDIPTGVMGSFLHGSELSQ